MTVHDFQHSLDKSEEYAEAPFWEDLYRQIFPNLSGICYVKKDGWAQRGGIDRRLVMEDGSTVTTDEKVREEAWPDFCLEYYSDKQRKVPGWVAKDLACDYIAYLYLPTMQLYLLPFKLLRRAWKTNYRSWVRQAKSGEHNGFRIVQAENRNYITESVAVPHAVLFDAITDAMAATIEDAPVDSPQITDEEMTPDYYLNRFDEEVLS